MMRKRPVPKRLTETQKWEDPWFLDLKPQHKLMWLYIIDRCDHAGIYKHSDKATSFHVGAKLSFDKFLEAVNGRLIKVSDDAYFIPTFIKFQYGLPLNVNNSAHRGVIKVLNYYGLIDKQEGAIKGLGSCLKAAKDKDKDKHIHKDPTYKDKVIAIVDDLNVVLDKKYRAIGLEGEYTATGELIVDRLKDGFGVEDFKACHRNQKRVWGGDPKMSKYLRPVTLYGKQKFENYVNNTPSEAELVEQQASNLQKIRDKLK